MNSKTVLLLLSALQLTFAHTCPPCPEPCRPIEPPKSTPLSPTEAIAKDVVLPPAKESEVIDVNQPPATVSSIKHSEDAVIKSPIQSAMPGDSYISNAPLTRPIPGPICPPPLHHCITHKLVPVPVQVVDECITTVPVVRKTLRHRLETITRHVKVVENTVTPQEEKIVRHVPVVQKSIRNIIETRTRHIPVIKSRSRTVVEPYTVHVAVTEKYCRPVEDSITRKVPYTISRFRPIVSTRTRFVPVVHKRIRPVVVSRIETIPVKRRYLRTFVERRARPIVAPCCPCIDRPQCQNLCPPCTPVYQPWAPNCHQCTPVCPPCAPIFPSCAPCVPSCNPPPIVNLPQPTPIPTCEQTGQTHPQCPFQLQPSCTPQVTPCIPQCPEPQERLCPSYPQVC